MVSPTLTVRLNDEIKEQMLSYPDTNWSAFVRMAIQKELERLQRSDASQLIEQVRERLPETTPPAVSLIRAMRQGRPHDRARPEGDDGDRDRVENGEAPAPEAEQEARS